MKLLVTTAAAALFALAPIAAEAQQSPDNEAVQTAVASKPIRQLEQDLNDARQALDNQQTEQAKQAMQSAHAELQRALPQVEGEARDQLMSVKEQLDQVREALQSDNPEQASQSLQTTIQQLEQVRPETQQVSAQDLREMGARSYLGVWDDKYKAVVTVKEDGTLEGKSGIFSDSGKWELRGDTLCVSFYWWTWDQFRCSAIHRYDDWLVGMFREGEPRLWFRPL